METSGGRVADRDISHQALSERLRRANRTLVITTVHDPDASEERAEERDLETAGAWSP